MTAAHPQVPREYFQNLGQKRAKHAFEALRKLFEKNGAKFDKEVADPAKKLPYRIRTAGLGMTIAFIEGAGGKREGRLVLDELAKWCASQQLIAQPSVESMSEAYRHDGIRAMQRLTEESLAYLEWFVRFADAKKG